METRSPTPKIQTFENVEIRSHAPKLILEDSDNLPVSKRIYYFFLRLMFRMRHGVVWVFEFGESLYAERHLLENLKSSSFIDSYGEGPIFADYPHMHFFGITFRHRHQGDRLHAWGYSLPGEKKEKALRGALWETIERHATYYDPKATTVTYPTFSQGDASWLFKHIPHYTVGQQTEPDLVHTEQALQHIRGLRVRSITGGGARFFPINTFYWGNRNVFHPPFTGDMTTSGCGGGKSRNDALCSAVYELLERDAFLLHWYTKIAPPRLSLSSEMNEFTSHVHDAQSRFGLEVYFFDLTYDVSLPITACLLIDPVLNILAMGAKASMNREDTLRGAYLEALATLFLVRSRNRNIDPTLLERLHARIQWGSREVDKSVRVNLYNSPEGIEIIKHIWCTGTQGVTLHNTQTTLIPEQSTPFEHMCSEFRRLVRDKGEGYHVYAQECNSSLTKKFQTHVVRAYVPALLKLHLEEHFVAPLSSRVFEFARAHGKNFESEIDLNHLPHPFP